MDLIKIAQELNKSYIDLLKSTYAKVYELASDIESSPGHQNQVSAPAVAQIMKEENQFGIKVNRCKDKNSLRDCLSSLRSFYVAVTSNIKAGKIKLESKYSRDSLQEIANNYATLSKMV